ncbi:HD domain-containing protein [archaeon]|nr:HD domain-containing protein [archaeon]
MLFTVPCKQNEKLKNVVKAVQKNKQLNTLLRCANITAIDRMGYSDHGPVHVKIVANMALEMLRTLVKSGVTPSIVKDHKLDNDDAEVVVVLGALLHDIGMVVHRKNHDMNSAMITFNIIDELLPGYDEEKRTIIKVEVVHCVFCHEDEIQPLTVEAGIVTIADALDMSEGRARIPFDAGVVDIHSVSALAIKNVNIEKGKKKPVHIRIEMSNSAGIFQIDNLLKPRVLTSGLREYIDVSAEVSGQEKSIIQKIKL